MRKKLFCPECEQGLIYILPARVYHCIDCHTDYDDNLQRIGSLTPAVPDAADAMSFEQADAMSAATGGDDDFYGLPRV